MLKHILGLVEEGGNAVIEEDDDDDIPLVKNYCMLYTKYFPRCTEHWKTTNCYCSLPTVKFPIFSLDPTHLLLVIAPKDSYRSRTQFYISSTTINKGFIINKVEVCSLFNSTQNPSNNHTFVSCYMFGAGHLVHLSTLSIVWQNVEPLKASYTSLKDGKVKVPVLSPKQNKEIQVKIHN